MERRDTFIKEEEQFQKNKKFLQFIIATLSQFDRQPSHLLSIKDKIAFNYMLSQIPIDSIRKLDAYMNPVEANQLQTQQPVVNDPKITLKLAQQSSFTDDFIMCLFKYCRAKHHVVFSTEETATTKVFVLLASENRINKEELLKKIKESYSPNDLVFVVNDGSPYMEINEINQFAGISLPTFIDLKSEYNFTKGEWNNIISHDEKVLSEWLRRQLPKLANLR